MAGIILCLFYIAGLLSTIAPETAYGLPLLGIVAAVAMPKLWRSGPRSPLWIVAGIIGFCAAVYFQMRFPQPAANDISNVIIQQQVQPVKVRGTVANTPLLNRSNKVRFELEAEKVWVGLETQEVTGKLYATVPLLQGTGLHPGLEIEVMGYFYIPQSPKDPEAFNFKEYLARQGIFAGVAGDRINWDAVEENDRWGLWKLRKRIIQAQMRGLGSPEGQVVSAMVMGRRSVDLPYEIRDRVTRVGLAHALAASGFHVALILGFVLAFFRGFSEKVQFIAGTIVLVGYTSLVGFQPSILRAALMGFGGLIALASDRQVRPISGLVLVATILLLWNPLWIQDIGFQLSFLATFGLIAMAKPLADKLDFLPETIAVLFAVPIAAIIWTLPVQMYHFKVVATYSIIVNVLVVPFLSAITIVGFVSAVVSLIYAPAGSAIAWLLEYPVRGLLAIVSYFYNLPGSRFSVGTILAWQLVAIYVMMFSAWGYVVWQNNRKEEEKSWRRLPFMTYILIAIASLAIVIVPIWDSKANLFRVTVLETHDRPVLVIEDGTDVILVNSGDEATIRYSVIPFLQREAINTIDAAIATRLPEDKGESWLLLFSETTVQKFYGSETAIASDDLNVWLENIGEYESISVGESVTIGEVTIALVSLDPNVWRLDIGDRDWLLLENIGARSQNLLAEMAADVLLWSGRSLSEEVLQAVDPEIAIVYGDRLDEETKTQLENRNVQVFWPQEDGPIVWTQERGVNAIDELEGGELF